jgi:hypothetical protein
MVVICTFPLTLLYPLQMYPQLLIFWRSSAAAGRPRNLETAKASQKRQADKKRRPHTVNVGDLVLLSTKNLALKGVSRKLAPRFIGPYRVVHTRGTAATLDLPPELGKVHPTFHVSLLQPFRGEDAPAPQQLELEEESGEFEVEALLSRRINRGKIEFLVK